MVLLGKINSDILVRLNRHGQPAVGPRRRGRRAFEVRPAANAEQVGFVGEIEKVNVDVIDHIAEDYVPVIASVGTDRDGAVLQRQRRRGGRQGRRRDARPQGDLPDRRRRLAA